jgi:hypothetical protein
MYVGTAYVSTSRAVATFGRAMMGDEKENVYTALWKILDVMDGSWQDQ